MLDVVYRVNHSFIGMYFKIIYFLIVNSVLQTPLNFEVLQAYRYGYTSMMKCLT